MNLPVKIRSLKEEDESFIYSSWLKSYRNSDFASQVSNDIYYSSHKKIIEDLMNNNNVEFKILCEPDDEEHLYGYLAYEKLGAINIVHFIYVKYNYRKFGLAKQLMEDSIDNLGEQDLYCSHAPKSFKSLKEKYKLVYTPYILLKDK